jgi:hypothetical protein
MPNEHAFTSKHTFKGADIMKNRLMPITLAAALALAAPVAKADPGLFGQPVQLDGSMEMRRSTTEQFDPVRGQSVADRPRPDYDATPIGVGSFEFFPVMNFTNYYDSNIFAQPSGETSDDVWKLNPAFTMLSNWGRNAVAFTGYGDFDYYTVNNEQNYNSGALQAEGRWDIAHQTWLDGAMDYQRVVELRGAPSTPGNAEGPSEYNLYQGNAEAYRGLGLLKTKLGYNVAYYDYSPLDLIGGGAASQNARDRVQNGTTAEVSYDLTENFQPFVRGGYNWRNYTATDTRSSNGYNIDVGSKMDFGGITTAEAYIGYLTQDYFNFGDDIGALDFGGDLLWNVTGLTSVEFKAQRSIEETDITPATTSYIASTGSVTVTHELRRNVLLDAHFVYTGLDYQGVFRHDDYYDGGTGLRYLINRNLYADFTCDYERRGSDASGSNYNRHILLTRLGIQY